MKYLLYLTIIFLIACNDNEKAAKKDASDLPSKEKELKDLVTQYPDSALLVENLVQYYRENGDYSNAISSMKTALAKDSTNARFWDVMGYLQMENGDTLQSILALERSVDLYPQPDVVISLGIIYAQTKNPNALAVADGLILADKARAEKEALFIKGLYYSNTGEKNKSLVFFNQAISLSYTFMEAHREKAIALYDLGKYNDAIKALDLAIEVQHNFDEGYYYLGRCYEKLKDIPKAIEAYQAALSLDPNYVEARDALGKLGVKS